MSHRLQKILRLSLKLVLFFLLALILLIVYFLIAIHQSEPEISSDKAISNKTIEYGNNFIKTGNNWLKKSESGLWEMYVEGDGFERGVANGKLTKHLAEFQETVFINQIKVLVPSESYLQFLKYFVGYFNRHMPKHISDEYLREIYGVSLSASDKFDHLAPKYYRILNYHSAHDIGHALQDKNMVVGCTSFGVKDSKTLDGKMLIGRNFDFFAGDDFALNKIVCFTNPKCGYNYAYITWAGFTGVVSGMNEKGLTVTINASKSDIPKSAATPISILAKEILQYATNIEQAYDIALQRETFVSESILIGSAKDKKTVIIEKTPSKTNLFSDDGDQIICSNNFRSKLFTNDYVNNKNILESSSIYRYFRMKQLLRETEKFTPEKVAEVLRNQKGINNLAIGLGNEKGINQLIAHHSVIFKPEDGLMWVSASPYQLGKMVCYDLKKVFAHVDSVKPLDEIQEFDKTIAADSFLFTPDYKNFILFKQMRTYFNYCISSPFNLTINQKHIDWFEQSNPNSYLTYQTIGDYYRKRKDNILALKYYYLALSKEVATNKEAEQIRFHIKQLEDPNSK